MPALCGCGSPPLACAPVGDLTTVPEPVTRRQMRTSTTMTRNSMTYEMPAQYHHRWLDIQASPCTLETAGQTLAVMLCAPPRGFRCIAQWLLWWPASTRLVSSNHIVLCRSAGQRVLPHVTWDTRWGVCVAFSGASVTNPRSRCMYAEASTLCRMR